MTQATALFDRTLQAMNLLLKNVREELSADSRDQAYAALRASLHALRAHLPPTNVAQLANQMTTLLRGVFLEGWRPGKEAPDGRTLAAFLDEVGRELPPNFPFTTECSVRAVFKVLRTTMDDGELRQAIACLPRPIKELWAAPRRGGRQARIHDPRLSRLSGPGW